MSVYTERIRAAKAKYSPDDWQAQDHGGSFLWAAGDLRSPSLLKWRIVGRSTETTERDRDSYAFELESDSGSRLYLELSSYDDYDTARDALLGKLATSMRRDWLQARTQAGEPLAGEVCFVDSMPSPRVAVFVRANLVCIATTLKGDVDMAMIVSELANGFAELGVVSEDGPKVSLSVSRTSAPIKSTIAIHYVVTTDRDGPFSVSVSTTVGPLAVRGGVLETSAKKAGSGSVRVQVRDEMGGVGSAELALNVVSP